MTVRKSIFGDISVFSNESKLVMFKMLVCRMSYVSTTQARGPILIQFSIWAYIGDISGTLITYIFKGFILHKKNKKILKKSATGMF